MTTTHTSAPEALTALILSVFRANGALIDAGDALVKDIGLTSARWQVLGAIGIEGRPISVAQIARRMGLTRQAVQRVVNDLETRGHLSFQPNPDHKRAALVAFTPLGERAFAEATARQAEWAAALSMNLSTDALMSAAQLLDTLNTRLALSAQPNQGY